MQSTIQGEWWLIGSSSHFADGDVQDINHDYFVWSHLVGELVDEINTITCTIPQFVRDVVDTCSRWGSYDGDPTYLRTIINDYSDAESRSGTLPDDITEDPGGYIQRLLGWDDEKWNVLVDNDESDGRFWAAKHLGWVRMAGNNLQLVAPLTDERLDDLVAAICDAVQSDMGYTDINHEAFTIEVMSSDGKSSSMYYDVPWLVLSSGRVAALRDFKNHA